MPDYKAPVGRESIKKSAKMLLNHWIEKHLDDSGEKSTAWDDADDIASNTYEDEIEGDKSHAEAMEKARKRFYDELKELLHILIENVFDTIDWDDPSYSSHGTLREEIGFFKHYGGQ